MDTIQLIGSRIADAWRNWLLIAASPEAAARVEGSDDDEPSENNLESDRPDLALLSTHFLC